MTKPHTITVIDTIHTVLSKDGARLAISPWEMGHRFLLFPAHSP